MTARREMGAARRSRNLDAGSQAKVEVDRLKRALGERGDPWWTDGAPDWNRHLVRNTPYAEWFDALQIPPGTAG